MARRRNFSRAAHDLNIAQQAVSQQIKALEQVAERLTIGPAEAAEDLALDLV